MVTRSLRKELGSSNSSRNTTLVYLIVLVVIIAVTVIVVEATHCQRTSLPPPVALSRIPALLPPRLSGESEERRRSSSSNYFSLASKHFNATSTNSFRSRCRATTLRPRTEQNRVTSSPLRSPVLYQSRAFPFSVKRTRSQPPEPPLNADHESALFQSRANGNNSPR